MEKAFAFVRDNELRQNLERDYSELSAVKDAGAWKSVHVLAGSVVEAALADFVQTSGIAIPRGKTALELSLGEMIDLCVQNKFLEKSTSDLASVIRDYRNLIHPGRVVRTANDVTADTAQIAASLVEIVLKKIEINYAKVVGYDAEQFLSKVVRDDDVTGIVDHLIAELKYPELRRLIFELMPPKYAEIPHGRDASKVRQSLQTVFQRCRSKLTDDDQIKFHESFAERIRSRDKVEIRDYANAFYNCTKLALAPDRTKKIVVDYVKHRLSATGDFAAAGLCFGVFRCLEQGDFDLVGRALLFRAYVRSDPVAHEVLGHDFWWMTPEEVDRLANMREKMAKDYEVAGEQAAAHRLRTEQLEELPF